MKRAHNEKETNEQHSTLKNDIVSLWLPPLSSSSYRIFLPLLYIFVRLSFSLFATRMHANFNVSNVSYVLASKRKKRKWKKKMRRERVCMNECFEALFNSASPLFEPAFDIPSNNFCIFIILCSYFSSQWCAVRSLHDRAHENQGGEQRKRERRVQAIYMSNDTKGKYCEAVSFAMLLSFCVRAVC